MDAAACEVGGCGVLAIGRCHRCGQAFCASHRAHDGGRRIVDECVPCLARVKAAASGDGSDADELLLAAIDHPIERLVTAYGMDRFAVIRRAPYDGGARSAPQPGPRTRGVIEALHPAWTSSDLDRSPPWSGPAVAQWFAQAASARGVEPTDTHRALVEHTVGWRRRVEWRPGAPEAAWRFPEGSTETARERQMDAFVFPDGRFSPSEPIGFGPRPGFGALALIEMAVVLDLV